MPNINYWKQFESTGKIDDYLSYRCCLPVGGRQQNLAERESAGQLGVNPYAGIYMRDRNDIETDAYRGI